MAAAAAEAAAAALPGADALQEQEHQPLVLDGTIADMAAAVQRGDFAAAEAAGGSAALPLSLPRGCLSGLAPIFEGAQASVYSAQLRPASLLAVGAPNVSSSGGGGTDSLAVAVKKPRIRETADLERFRREVALLGRLRHAHIVCLLGARLLPPGARGRGAARLP